MKRLVSILLGQVPSWLGWAGWIPMVLFITWLVWTKRLPVPMTEQPVALTRPVLHGT